MIIIKPTAEQIEYAEETAKKSNIKSEYAGSQEQQAIGFLGETVICDAMGFERPTPHGFNGGFDIYLFTKKIDIKTMSRTTEVQDYYVHNFLDHQKKHPAACFIFCSYNRTAKILTVCGFISKTDYFRQAKFYKKGEIRTMANGKQFPAKGDMYEIRQDQIMPVNTFDDIRDYVKREERISKTGELLRHGD